MYVRPVIARKLVGPTSVRHKARTGRTDHRREPTDLTDLRRAPIGQTARRRVNRRRGRAPTCPAVRGLVAEGEKT